MGYRSDVVMAIHFPDREQMVGFFSFMRMNSNPAVAEVLDEMHTVGDDVACLICQGVKWYDGYPFVNATHFILDQARERDFANCFMRVGEEINDTEYEMNDDSGVLYELFDVRRELVFPAVNSPLMQSLTKTEE